MSWIVIGERNGKIALTSKSEVKGLLPKGAYLTIEDGSTKFILRVDDTQQYEPYSPSPLIVDMDLSPLAQDQKCQNIITAYRVKDMTDRDDGLIAYIKPQSIARRATQEEVDLAMDSNREGPPVFLATLHASQNQLLIDENNKYITTRLPKDTFFHQMLICGKTGSGKTVATKNLAQYFTEELGGAVLAINVKDVDFLRMNKPSKTTNESILKEWESINGSAKGMDNFMVYYPANTEISETKGISPEICQKITLNVNEIDPEALIGLLQGISDKGTQNLPNLFRYWQSEVMKREGNDKFSDFVRYFSNGLNDRLVFRTLNSRGEESEVTLHRGTFDNILRNLDIAVEFFDNDGADSLNEDNILESGKMSVIDVANKNGIVFGSILLRHLLHKIVEAKSEKRSDIPVLIIIDEVHMFYNTDASLGALGDLDTICRTGRSQEIGVIFSSQNPADIPKGLSSVINTKIFFKSDAQLAKLHGVSVSREEMESLKKGFAVASIHELHQAKIIKFPLAYAGVFE